MLRVEADTAAGPPVVLVTKLKAGDGRGHFEISASVQAFDQTPVFARTSGYVKARYVDIGDHVRKGQLLAVIDDPQTAQALMQAKATVAQLKAQLAQSQANSALSTVTDQRWQSLVSSGVVSQQDADTRHAQAGADTAAVAAAQANIAAGEANVRSLTEQASFSRVTAPFNGIILSRAIDNGSLISSGSQTGVTQMFSIGQAPIRCVSLPACPRPTPSGWPMDMSRRSPSASFRARSTPEPSRAPARASIQERAHLLVEVDLKNDGRILPGMYATVIFDLPRSSSAPVLLPANALVIRTSGPQAVVLDSNNVAALPYDRPGPRPRHRNRGYERSQARRCRRAQPGRFRLPMAQRYSRVCSGSAAICLRLCARRSIGDR